MVLMDDFKNILINKINDILNLDNEKWNILEKNIKLKLVVNLFNPSFNPILSI